MANYLVAKCNTVTKSYSLRDIEPSSKPYLRVSNSYLPLSSGNTTTGLQIKANNNVYGIQESYTTTVSSTINTTNTYTSYWQRSTLSNITNYLTLGRCTMNQYVARSYTESYMGEYIKTIPPYGRYTTLYTTRTSTLYTYSYKLSVEANYYRWTLKIANYNSWYFTAVYQQYTSVVPNPFNGSVTASVDNGYAYATPYIVNGREITVKTSTTSNIYYGSSIISNNTYRYPYTYTKTTTNITNITTTSQ